MRTLEEADVRPMDLILFRGVDAVSNAICVVEAKKKGRGDFSHAGLAVTREVLDLPFLEPGKVYVWESTMSAPAGFWSKFTDQVGDAEGRDEVRFGVQLRDLELVIPAYEASGGHVAWSSFGGERPPDDEARAHLHQLYQEYGHAPYTANLLEVFGVVFPHVRHLRDAFDSAEDRLAHFRNHILEKAHAHGHREDGRAVEDSHHHVFCSQWVAMVYQSLELVDIKDPRLVAPVDFLAHPLFEEPVPLVPEDPESV